MILDFHYTKLLHEMTIMCCAYHRFIVKVKWTTIYHLFINYQFIIYQFIIYEEQHQNGMKWKYPLEKTEITFLEK